MGIRKERLLEYAENSQYDLSFEFDKIGMTWGVSYVRFTYGTRGTFENIEHFFFSCLKSDKNQSSLMAGGPRWEERVDMKKWILGLDITPINPDSLIHFIKSSLLEIEKESVHWKDTNTIDPFDFEVPIRFDDCWILKETDFPRHYINCTEIYLANSMNGFYCIEGHWES